MQVQPYLEIWSAQVGDASSPKPVLWLYLKITTFGSLIKTMQAGEYNDAIAILLLRTVTGILFFFQGYDKLFNVKIDNVVRTFSEPLGKFHLSPGFLKPAISVSSFLELACGLLLFTGLFKDITLFILAGNMIFVAFIFSALKPMWDMQHFFPRMIFLVILLFCLPEQDIFSLDYFLSAR